MSWHDHSQGMLWLVLSLEICDRNRLPVLDSGDYFIPRLSSGNSLSNSGIVDVNVQVEKLRFSKDFSALWNGFMMQID